MSRPTSYQLLKDVHEAIYRLEAKMDRRISSVEARVDVLEDFKSRMLGIAGVIGAVVSLSVNWFWKKISQ